MFTLRKQTNISLKKTWKHAKKYEIRKKADLGVFKTSTPKSHRGLKLQHQKLQCFYYAHGEFQEDLIKIAVFFREGGSHFLRGGR